MRYKRFQITSDALVGHLIPIKDAKVVAARFKEDDRGPAYSYIELLVEAPSFRDVNFDEQIEQGYPVLYIQNK